MEHAIDVKILLMNNGYLGMVRQWQTLFYDGRYAGTPMKNPDYGAIAGAYGIPYMKVSRPEQVDEAIQTAIDHKGPSCWSSCATPVKSSCPWCRPAGGIKR
jgi:acetolactate synthase-1/2/3 large subunit